MPLHECRRATLRISMELRPVARPPDHTLTKNPTQAETCGAVLASPRQPEGKRMPEMILHHYDTSPYAEKVRTTFGIKRLAWRSVEIPRIMPKPDLMPLTGGYRKTPVLQIGADVYCDTQLILREIDRRHPQPPLNPHPGLGDALAWWAEKALFTPSVIAAFAVIGDQLPESFKQDRAK